MAVSPKVDREGAGRGALGKTLVAVAVEVHDPRGFGRARLHVIPDASKVSLSGFVTDTIEPGATVRTDGWRSYTGLDTLGYTHEPVNVSATGEQAHVSLPGVHRVASLFKRSLLNAYQQYPKLHLQAYCNEWVFRFNRRHSRARGMLFFRLMELAVQAGPLPYSALIRSERPREISPIPPGGAGRPRRAAVNGERRPCATPDLDSLTTTCGSYCSYLETPLSMKMRGSRFRSGSRAAPMSRRPSTPRSPAPNTSSSYA